MRRNLYIVLLALLAWPLLANAGTGETCGAPSAPAMHAIPDAPASGKFVRPQSGPGESRVVELKAFTAIGLGVDAPGFDPSGIPATWEQFMLRQAELGERGAVYGVSRLREDGFYYVVGAEHAALDPLPEGMEQVDVPAGKYFRHHYSGPAMELGNEYMRLFMELLPAAGLTAVEGGLAVEAYPEQAFDEETGTMTLTIYVQLSE